MLAKINIAGDVVVPKKIIKRLNVDRQIVKVTWHIMMPAAYGRFNRIRQVAPVCTCARPPLVGVHTGTIVYPITSGPPESNSQTASRSVPPFSQGLLLWQTDKQARHATRSVTVGRIDVCSTSMRPNNRSNLLLRSIQLVKSCSRDQRVILVITSSRLANGTHFKRRNYK